MGQLETLLEAGGCEPSQLNIDGLLEEMGGWGSLEVPSPTPTCPFLCLSVLINILDVVSHPGPFLGDSCCWSD